MRLRELASRIRGMFSRNRLDRDLDEELSVHLEMLVEENVRWGMCLKEARYAARRSFGGLEQTKEAYRGFTGPGSSLWLTDAAKASWLYRCRGANTGIGYRR